MYTYIVKNVNDYTVVLKDANGEAVYQLGPNELLAYQSSEALIMPVFEKLYERGSVDYWVFEVSDVVTREKVEWIKEGF